MFDIFLSGVGFGAIGFLLVKVFVSDAYPDKFVGALVFFVIGVVIMSLGKLSDSFKKK